MNTPKESYNVTSKNDKTTFSENPENNSTSRMVNTDITPRNSDRNQLEGISLKHWHEHFRCHRSEMEVRRSIEIKVFTGCVVILLLMGKTGYNALVGPEGTEQIRLAHN